MSSVGKQYFGSSVVQLRPLSYMPSLSRLTVTATGWIGQLTRAHIRPQDRGRSPQKKGVPGATLPKMPGGPKYASAYSDLPFKHFLAYNYKPGSEESSLGLMGLVISACQS